MEIYHIDDCNCNVGRYFRAAGDTKKWSQIIKRKNMAQAGVEYDKGLYEKNIQIMLDINMTPCAR